VPISEAYPTHFGSHPNYDIEIGNAINNSLATKGVDLNQLDNLTNQQIIDLIDDIEYDAVGVLEDWNPSKLN
jgi:hypothetical protein